MKILTGDELLIRFAEIAPYLNSVIAEDIGVSVIQGDRYLTYVPCATLDLGIKAGDFIISPAVQRCMTTGKRVIRRFSLETSKFGVPYIAYALPVIENDQVVGCIVTTQTVSNQEEVKVFAADLAALAEEITVNMHEVSVQNSTLSKTCIAIEKQNGELLELVRENGASNQLCGDGSEEGETLLTLKNALQQAGEQIVGLKMDNAIMKKDLEEQASSISEIAKATQEVSSLAVHLAALVEKNSSVIDT